MSSIDKQPETSAVGFDSALSGDEPPMLTDEAVSILTHAEMRGMFYRNEITREELYQLESEWASASGRPLPTSALRYAKERAATEGFRYWFWHEQQSLPVPQLLELAKQRGELIRARATQKPIQDEESPQ